MVFVSKEDIKRVLIEKKLAKATSFKNRCARKEWKRAGSKYYDVVLSAFGLIVSDAKELNQRRDKLWRCLNNTSSLGVNFDVKRASMETSYCEESDDEADRMSKTINEVFGTDNIELIMNE